MSNAQLLLLLAVVAVGIFHTVVPDHWMPIALLARARRWTSRETARAAAIAGIGHTASTLIIGVLVWIAGAAFAVRFGHAVSLAASIALIAFGVWFVVASLRELREGHDHHHEHDVEAAQSSRITLLLIVGSSPMIEGLPAFLAASRFGVWQLVAMSLLFAAATIVTYVVLCVQAASALERLSFGPLERYGEVISGAVIAIVGVASLWF